MFCANCGTKQNEGEKFCPNCGTRFEEPLITKEVIKQEVKAVSVDENKPKNDNVHKNIKNEIAKKNTNKVASQKENNEAKTDAIASIIETISKAKQSVKVEEVKKDDVETVTQVKAKAKEQKINTTKVKKENIDDAPIVNEVKKEEPSVCVDTKHSNIVEDKNKLNVIDKQTDKSDIELNEEEQLACIMNSDNSETQLQWAIRYELGLGVSENKEIADMLYDKVGCKYNISKSLVTIDRAKQSGVISCIYDVHTSLIYDSAPDMKKQRKLNEEKRKKEAEEAKRLKEKMIAETEKQRKLNEEKRKKEAEEAKKLKEKMIAEMYTIRIDSSETIKFKFYIQQYNKYELKKTIDDYNNVAKIYGYDVIVFDENKSLIQGQFKEKYIDKGFLSFLYTDKSKKTLEKGLKEAFIDICNLCESLKIK